MLYMPSEFPTGQILSAAILASIAYLFIYIFYSGMSKKNAYLNNCARDGENRFLVVWLLIAAFVLRFVLSYQIVGHGTDISCFTAWGDRIAVYGVKDFYSSSFADYPPGYMYILGLMSKIARLFGLSVRVADGSYNYAYVALIKLPSIIADLAAAYMIYRLARKKLRFMPSFLIMALVALNPVSMYISGGWGQIDQILSVLLLGSILLLGSNKPILGGIVYGFAILMKPQALMAGPLLAIAYILYIFDDDFFKNTQYECNDARGKRLIKTVIAVACACILIIVAAIPFATESMPWYQIIYEKYLGTATSYKYASVNAYNIYTLFGKNWTSISQTAILGLNFGQVGTIGMIFSVGFSFILYLIGRKKHQGALPLATAYMFTALFTLGHYMHERYLFPVLLLLIAAYLFYQDKRLLWMFIGYGATLLVNCLAAFEYSRLFDLHLYWDERIVFWCSLANVLLFALFTYTVVRIMICDKLTGDVFEGRAYEELPKDGEENEQVS
ncbi:MAG: DUF2029 domain-containing protein [Christensenellaceae bacterium]|nr:DUF2029 domain-containing protein [Christensenellaceae bacterium]